MRNYYYCEANCTIYTEREKNKSCFPGCRFEIIGEFKKRVQAENAWLEKHPLGDLANEKRR